MFFEFSPSDLEKWNNLSLKQQKQLLEEQKVELSATIEIKIESHNQLLEEHKYYQVIDDRQMINGIMMDNINMGEIELSINTFDNSEELENIIVKLNEEKIVEIGMKPYQYIFKIKLLEIKYGRILEL